MLTEMQKHAARFHGSESIKRQRTGLRRLRTSLATLCETASDADALTLEQACRIVARMAQDTADDIREADRIRKQWVARRESAAQALLRLPATSSANIVALLHAAHLNYEIKLLFDNANDLGWASAAQNARADAIADLTHRYASGDLELDVFMARLDTTMAEGRARHADLIATLTTLAVSQQLEAAA